MEQEMSRNKNTNKNINKNMEMGAETEFLTPTHRYDDIINLPHPISPHPPAYAHRGQSRPVHAICSPDRACGGNQGNGEKAYGKVGRVKTLQPRI